MNVLTGVFRLGAVVQSGPRARPVSPKGGIAQTCSPAARGSDECLASSMRKNLAAS